MGIPKASRKGKKAWRKNIDAQEVEDFLQQESHKQVREPAVQTLKDEDLFVEDKAPDDSAVPAAVRKRKQQQEKLLRPQLILASHKDGIKPLHVPTKHKAKGPARPLPGSLPGGPAALAAAAEAAAAAAAAAAARGKRKPDRRRGLKVSDIWSETGPDPDQDWTAPATGHDLIKLGKRKQQQQQQGDAAGGDNDRNPEGGADGTPAKAASAAPAAKRSKRRLQAPVAPVPAVEVDAAGCSFNPEPEAHQDALAMAVAAEYKKQLAEELAPKAPSLYAPAGYKPGDELDDLLVDAEPDEDEEDEQAAAAAAGGTQQLPAAALQDENAIALDDDSDDVDAAADDDAATAAAAAGSSGGGGSSSQPASAAARVGAAGKAAQRVDRKTRKDRNREARRKQQEAEAAAKAALKQQRRELEHLADLQEQLQQEEQEKEALRQRRQASAAERAASEPPKLGKHRFEAPGVAVLTSDEVTGSLRQLKPCFLLAADRFKALQKRGLVEPRKPAGRKQGKRIEYVGGERQEKARERQQEIEDIKKARKKASKSGSAEAAAAVVQMAGGKSKRNKKQRAQQQQQQGPLLAPGSILPLAVAAGEGGQ